MKRITFYIITLVVLTWSQSQSQTYWELGGNNTVSSTDYIGTINSADFKIITDNTQKAVVTSAGNVGIGTTGPGNLLHMNKSGATDELYLQWTTGNTNSTLGMIMGVNTSNQGVINMKDQKPIRFYTLLFY